ncbi:hypothetical protein GUJ93_ZPchr0006g46269 [Zizania palustris]|uniref:Uncharacterized protein n=1 Tax=Zizania palustris TaxID=103762 RepID=A0A8J5SF49_ZIZPA|nr:hypothetical protein GUJ93_ZPchr0006g46269 [Zizania palustris]
MKGRQFRRHAVAQPSAVPHSRCRQRNPSPPTHRRPSPPAPFASPPARQLVAETPRLPRASLAPPPEPAIWASGVFIYTG